MRSRSKWSTAGRRSWPTTGSCAAAPANSAARLRHDAAGTQRRVDSPQNLFAELAEQTASPIVDPGSYAKPLQPAKAPRPEFGQFVAWFVTFIGFTSLAAGLGMIGWSIAHGGSEFWDHALALTLAGQGLLIFGLVLVVTRLWRNSRYASGKLQEVHAELGQLQRTADALSAMRSGGAPAFYAELVRGASPQMLLTQPQRPARSTGDAAERPIVTIGSLLRAIPIQYCQTASTRTWPRSSSIVKITPTGASCITRRPASRDSPQLCGSRRRDTSILSAASLIACAFSTPTTIA